jgi:hypothetical protein
MAAMDQADRAKSIAAELLRHAARRYPDVDAPTAWQAFVLAAADLREMFRARTRERSWVDAVPSYASANPWQVEDD